MSSRNNDAFRIGTGLAVTLLALFPSWIKAAPPELSNEEIFEKVFKKKPDTVQAEINMPIYNEASSRPFAAIKTLAGVRAEELKLDGPTIFSIIDQLVDAEVYRPLEIQGSELVETSDLRNQKWVDLSKLQTHAYTVRYDDKKLELRIHVMPEYRKKRTTSLSRLSSDEGEKVVIPPSHFSSFLNINATQGFVFGAVGAADTRQPLQSQFDGAMNLNGIVLEGSASYIENRGQGNDFRSWQRQDVRLVQDNPKLLLRDQLGDLSYPIRGFQSYRPMAGLSVFSNFGLQPSRLTTPAGRFEIFLKRPSQVSVVLNGMVVRVLDLPAGRHDFQNFPFASGPNDVRLEIKDDLGQTESYQLSYFMNTELLNAGLHQVAYSVGIPSHQNLQTRTYESSRPTASLFHRYGITDWLTAGINAQVDRDVRMLGAEALFSTPYGFFGIEPAQSSSNLYGSGLALRGRYLWLDGTQVQRSRRSFNLQVEAKQPGFSALTEAAPVNVAATLFQVGYTQALSDNTNLNTQLQYGLNRTYDAAKPAINSFRAAIGLGRTWGPGLSSNINIETSRDVRGVNQAGLSFNLNWNFPKDRQGISASYDVREEATRLDWNYTPGAGVGATNAHVGVKKDSRSRGFQGQIQYFGNRAILNSSAGSQWATGESTPLNRFDVQLGTALVFAGGRFSLSRPVSDSFVIVSPEKNLKGAVLELNPQGNSSYGETDWFGAATLPELSSYSYSNVVLGTQKLAQGLNIDHDHYIVYPSYKSGYAIVLGTDATASFGATLVNQDDLPIALQPGKVHSLSDASFEPITMFTGRNGRTRVDGFRPGKYELRLFDERWETAIIEIPEDKDYLDLGKITLKEKKLP